MSVSRDDFSIAFRSALLQRGATQKFSIFSLIIVALVVFFLDVYGFTVVKTARSFINDVVYRVTYLASAPTRLLPGINQGIASHFYLKKEIIVSDNGMGMTSDQLKLCIKRHATSKLPKNNLNDINKKIETYSNNIPILENNTQINIFFNDLLALMTTDNWSVLTMLTLWIGCILFLIYSFSKSIFTKRIFFSSGILSFLIFII